MKSIAILCNYKLDPKRVGGMDYFFWEFDTACKAAGHSVTWFFPNSASHGRYTELQIRAAESESIEQCFLRTLQNEGMPCDTIITHFLELCTPFFQKAKKMTAARIIAVDHNPRPSKGYSIRKRLKKLIGSLVYSRYVDLFIAVSPKTLEEFNHDFPSVPTNKTTIIKNGLPIERILIHKQMQRSKMHFMVSSHLRVEKAIEDLIYAIANQEPLLKEKICVDIYGDGPEKWKYKNLIHKYKLESVITLKGSTDQIHRMYAEYDYLIHPSHAETFCYAVVESLLANLPVITTQEAGNILKLVEDDINGYVYPVGDIATLTQIIKTVVEKELKLVIHSRSQIEKELSTVTMVSNYLDII